MQEMILASHPLMLLQHYGLPVIVALNHFGSDTGRELEMIGKRVGEQASKPSSVSTSRKARRAGASPGDLVYCHSNTPQYRLRESRPALG
jgi:formyltetrahydrofolate synthetase